MYLHAHCEEGKLFKSVRVPLVFRKARETAANERDIVDPDMGQEPLRSHIHIFCSLMWRPFFLLYQNLLCELLPSLHFKE